MLVRLDTPGLDATRHFRTLGSESPGVGVAPLPCPGSAAQRVTAVALGPPPRLPQPPGPRWARHLAGEVLSKQVTLVLTGQNVLCHHPETQYPGLGEAAWGSGRKAPGRGVDCAPVSALWCRGSSLRRALGDTPSWGPRSGPSACPWLGPSQEGPFRAGSGLPDGELREAGPAGGGQWAGFPPAARFLPPAPWGDRAAGSACGSTEQPPWGPCGHGLPAPGRLRALAVCREGGLSVPFRRDSEPAPSLAVQQTGRGACAGLGHPRHRPAPRVVSGGACSRVGDPGAEQGAGRPHRGRRDGRLSPWGRGALCPRCAHKPASRAGSRVSEDVFY